MIGSSFTVASETSCDTVVCVCVCVCVRRQQFQASNTFIVDSETITHTVVSKGKQGKRVK